MGARVRGENRDALPWPFDAILLPFFGRFSCVPRVSGDVEREASDPRQECCAMCHVSLNSMSETAPSVPAFHVPSHGGPVCRMTATSLLYVEDVLHVFLHMEESLNECKPYPGRVADVCVNGGKS
jgi:hypothetical protein